MKFTMFFLLSGTAYAAGDGHAGPSSLIWPAINLSVLLSLLVWKLKGPTSKMFADKATETKDMIESAAVKAKEAKMMMEQQQRKIDGADSEIEKLEAEAKTILEKYEQDYKVDVDQRVNQLKEDAGQKIEAEKKELLDDLNSQLLDQVIVNAKTKLQSDKNLSSEATTKILQGLN